MLALMYYLSPTNDGGLVCTYNKEWMMVPLKFSIEGALSMLMWSEISVQGNKILGEYAGCLKNGMII